MRQQTAPENKLAMRVIFMGTPGFAVPSLKALIESPHDVVAVYCQPPRPAGRGMQLTPSPVQVLAEKHGIPVFTPTSLKSAEAQEQFCNHAADVAVVAAYGLLLPQAILDAPRLGCMNVHPSDLPRWRGAAPIQRTVMAGDASTACCIMQMDAGLDTGAVLARHNVPLPPTMDALAVHDAMSLIGAKMVLEVLAQFENGTAKATPQGEDGVTYAAKITKPDRIINWEWPAERIYFQIQGLAPLGAITGLNNETIKILKAQVEAGDASKQAGEMLDYALLVNAGNGTALRLLELQSPSKTRQLAAQFLQSYPVNAGVFTHKPTH